MSLPERDEHGRFSGGTPDEILFEQAKRVAERTARALGERDGLEPEASEVTMAQFRAHKHLDTHETGIHVPEPHYILSRARTVWGQPELHWRPFLATITRTERDLRRVHFIRAAAEARVVTVEHITFALHYVLDFINREIDPQRQTLEPNEYQTYSDLVIERDSTAAERLPTAHEIETACDNSWDAALELAGLPPREKRHEPKRRNGCPIPLAIAAYVAENWDEPSWGTLNDWMRDDRGVALEGKKQRTWDKLRGQARREARKNGIAYPRRPGEAKPDGWRPTKIDLSGYSLHQGTRAYPRIKIVGDVKQYIDTYKGKARSDDRSWRKFKTLNPAVVGLAAIKAHGGLAALMREALRDDWEERAEAWDVAHKLTKPVDTSPIGRAILKALAAEGELSSAALAERIGAKPDSVRFQLRALIDSGKVERTRETVKSRFQTYRLTPAYRALVRKKPDSEAPPT